jgi:hypothetical protein
VLGIFNGSVSPFKLILIVVLNLILLFGINRLWLLVLLFVVEFILDFSVIVDKILFLP